jgi:RNA polymerase sigma factor (sigma-70 family)
MDVVDGAMTFGSPEEAEARSEPAVASYADFYAETHAAMVKLAYFMTGSREIGEDLTQDAYVRMHRRYGRVADPYMYLRRSVINACISHHRKLAVRRHWPEPRSEVNEFHANELFDVLMTLPARQRAAIVLRYWHDLSDDDIAAAIGCRPSNVRSLLHRGTAQLKRMIER